MTLSIMTREQKKLWGEWAKLMRRVDKTKKMREHFNMRHWYGLRGSEATTVGFSDQFAAEHFGSIKQMTSSCGTSACAAGWAAVHPTFIRAGAKKNNISSVRHILGADYGLLANAWNQIVFGNYYFRRGSGGWTKITPAMVADRIESFLRGEWGSPPNILAPTPLD